MKSFRMSSILNILMSNLQRYKEDSHFSHSGARPLSVLVSSLHQQLMVSLNWRVCLYFVAAALHLSVRSLCDSLPLQRSLSASATLQRPAERSDRCQRRDSNSGRRERRRKTLHQSCYPHSDLQLSVRVTSLESGVTFQARQSAQPRASPPVV